MEIREIDIEKIELLDDIKKIEDWKKRKFIRSIKKEGIIVPIVVCARDDKFICIDGNLRIKFAKELGYKKIKAVVLENLDDEKIRRARILLNTIKFSADALKLGFILRQIDEGDLKEFLMINDDIYDAIKEGVIDANKVGRKKKKDLKQSDGIKVKIKYNLSSQVFIKLIDVLSKIGNEKGIYDRDKQFEELIKMLYGNKESES